jgi:polysaccharide biosynthesis/export protein
MGHRLLMATQSVSREGAGAALTILLLIAGFVIPAAAPGAASRTSLVEVKAGTSPDAFLLVCDGEFHFNRPQISNPNLMVVDLPEVRNGIKDDKVTFKAGLVTGITVSPTPGGMKGTRVMFELGRPAAADIRVEGETLAVSFNAASSPGGPADPPAPAASAPGAAGTPLGSSLAAGVAGSASPARINTLPGTQRAEYVIGSEDLLELSVFEQPDLTRTVRVSGDGTISLPLLGVIPLSGLTTKEAEARLRDLLGEKYLTNPQVSVFVKEAKSKKVSVVGAVEKPGTVEMLGERTLLETISEAGGLTQQAGKELYVLRPDPSGATTRIDVDLDDLMINGNPELNIPILPGDVINIPIDRILHVYVDGAVRKPGEVEYKASRPLNLLQAIAAAGGLSERASQKGIVLIRNHPDKAQEILKIDLKSIRKGKELNLVLESGDSIFVPETFF